MKKSFLLSLLIIITAFLYGCNLNSFETGFETTIFSNDGLFVTGAKSEKRLFNIDEVELDFYFGSHSIPMHPDEINSSNELVGICAYFYSPKYEDNYSSFHDIYSKSIEDFYLIKKYEWEDLITKENQVKLKRKSLFRAEKIYNYHETFKIPSEMFSDEKGVVLFFVAGVWRNSVSEEYYLNDGDIGTGSITFIYYEKINESKIKIYEWNISL